MISKAVTIGSFEKPINSLGKSNIKEWMRFGFGLILVYTCWTWMYVHIVVRQAARS